MEFFLWFWLFDKRFLCDIRPTLKNFSFFWLVPIIIHLASATFNIYSLFPFRIFSKPQIILGIMTILETTSIICLIIMLKNLYNISKNQPKQQKNIFVLIYEEVKEDKNTYIYYEDYWMGRKNLLSANGIIILILSGFHIAWSFYYLFNRDIFEEMFLWVEKIVISYSYINIFLALPIVLVILYATTIKVVFALSAICCTGCVLSCSDLCCEKNKGLRETIDFSDIQKLEPEY